MAAIQPRASSRAPTSGAKPGLIGRRPPPRTHAGPHTPHTPHATRQLQLLQALPPACSLHRDWRRRRGDASAHTARPASRLHAPPLARRIILQDLCVIDVDRPELAADLERRFPVLSAAPCATTKRGVPYFFFDGRPAFSGAQPPSAIKETILTVADE